MRCGFLRLPKSDHFHAANFDGLPKLEVIDIAQDEDRFDNLAEGLQRSVKRMLLRVGVESPEDFRGSRLLEFDGCNESEDVVPVIFDDLSVDTARCCRSC